MLSENRLETLYGHLSDAEIEHARNNAFLNGTGIYNVMEGTCPVQNVVQDFVSKHFRRDDIDVEVGVSSEHAEFYVDEPQTIITIPVTHYLNEWMCTYARGEPVTEGVLHIFRDKDGKLQLGLDIELSKWDITDFDNLDGMERRLERRHINYGVKCETKECPVAKVLSEMFPHYIIEVDGECVDIRNKRGVTVEHLALSDNLSRWIKRFDDGEDVGTCTLIITKRDESQFEEDGVRYWADIKALSERQKDFHKSLSRLSELSAELEHFHEKITDRGEEDYTILQREYQDLFSHLVHYYGNNQ